MIIGWHDAAFTQPDATLTPEICLKIFNKFKFQLTLKHTWNKGEAAN